MSETTKLWIKYILSMIGLILFSIILIVGWHMYYDYHIMNKELPIAIVRPLPCNFCKSENTEVKGVIDDTIIYECNECGHIYD